MYVKYDGALIHVGNSETIMSFAISTIRPTPNYSLYSFPCALVKSRIFFMTSTKGVITVHSSGHSTCKLAQLDACSLPDCNAVFSISETNQYVLLRLA